MGVFSSAEVRLMLRIDLLARRWDRPVIILHI